MTVENPDVIDFVAYDPTGTVLLVMVEERQWDGSNERLYQLQEKINRYASFASEGQMSEKYPELAGKQICIELRCINQPDPKTAQFLERVEQTLQHEGFRFSVKLIGTNPSG